MGSFFHVACSFVVLISDELSMSRRLDISEREGAEPDVLDFDTDYPIRCGITEIRICHHSQAPEPQMKSA